jgi:hypothetical protein
MPGVLPAAPREESSNASPVPAKQGVGYKSLIEANANRPLVNPGTPAPVEETVEKPAEKPVEKPQAEKPQKGNRFVRGIGKIFHPGQKETAPLTLQPEPR